jgi:hypothetical protein
MSKRLCEMFPEPTPPPAKPCSWCGSDRHAPDWCASSIIQNEKTDAAERKILDKIVAIEYDALRYGKKLADYPQARILAAALGRKL